MMEETHIAGCVAYVKPEAGDAITKAIHATRLAEVARDDGRGHLVVLIESTSAGKVMDVIDAIRALDGVLAVHLAYQHAESRADLEEPQE